MERPPRPGDLRHQRFFEMVERNLYKIQYRVMPPLSGKTECTLCKGTRLKRGTIREGGREIDHRAGDDAHQRVGTLFDQLQLSETDATVAERILTEIRNRLGFLMEVGLGYLTLNRLSNTLSGGEASASTSSHRSGAAWSARSTSSTSQHSLTADTQRLIKVLKELQRIGNTVVVVDMTRDHPLGRLHHRHGP